MIANLGIGIIAPYTILMDNTTANANGTSANGATAGTSAAPATASQPQAGPSNGTAGATATQPQAGGDMLSILGSLLKTQTGEPVSNERVAQILVQNMATLVKQGKLNHQQILQLKQHADKYKATPQANAAIAGSSKPSTPAASTPIPQAATPASTAATHPAFKTGHETQPSLATTNPADYYPAISQTLSTTNPGPVPWTAAHPTLTGGLAAGRISGTPAQIARPGEDAAMLALDDNRTRRKNTPGDQSMRRTIQDLVASVDPNVKIEPEVEDLLLSIADEFIDSVTNFACRLAKHRGGDALEVRDLQLHLERNHNIRIPGFASDETRISMSQSNTGPTAASVPSKKGAQGTNMTLRSQRLAQVQQSKREAKLM